MVRVDDLPVSSADDFAPESYKLKLISRPLVVEVKEVDLLGLISTNGGDVPDFISGQVLAGMNGKKTAPGFTIDKNNMGEMFGFIDVIVKTSIISHRVVNANANRANGEINLSDLSAEDKLHIFNAVMPLEAGKALSFRKRIEDANLAAVRSGADDGIKTEQIGKSA